MSRSALWRQDGNVKERERNAEEGFHYAKEEGKNRSKKGIVLLTGSDETFNFNPMLLQQMYTSSYFIKICNSICDYNTLVDEIYYEVKHVEPWTKGAAKTPSTAFCLLLRLFTLRCSEKQMTLMLDHVDSPYIRCIGFLYLRYASNPIFLWQRVQPYIYDEEKVRIEASFSKPEISVGEYVRSLLTSMDYFGTLLPRLPIGLEREIKVKLLQAEETELRAQSHLNDEQRMNYFRTVGSRITALYGDEEHPITWYEAVVDRVITSDKESGLKLLRPTFIVTFPQYGNTEEVSLGEINAQFNRTEASLRNSQVEERKRISSKNGRTKARDRNGDTDQYDDIHSCSLSQNNERKNYASFHSEDKDSWREGDRGYREKERSKRYTGSNRGHNLKDDNYWNDERAHGRGRDRIEAASAQIPPRVSDDRNLMEVVLRREREKCAAVGKSYASRPATFKESISVRTNSTSNTELQKDRQVPNFNQNLKGRQSNFNQNTQEACEGQLPMITKNKRSAAELAAIEMKRRKLVARYG